MNQIKEILDSPQGKVLKELLITRCEELKNIDNLSDKGNLEEKAVELSSQKKAYKKLKSILEEILSYDFDPAISEDYNVE